MTYRAFPAPYGACSRHPETPAIGRCDEGCGARLCEYCLDFTMLAIRCVPCEQARVAGRARRRRRITVAAIVAFALIAPVIHYIAWHFPHGAHCMNDPSE